MPIARRNFVKVIDARGLSGAKGKTGSAEVALEYIRQLYRIEEATRTINLLPEEIQRATEFAVLC